MCGLINSKEHGLIHSEGRGKAIPMFLVCSIVDKWDADFILRSYFSS